MGIFSFLAVGLPFMGVPQLMVRFMSARSEKSLVPAMTISITVILLFDLGAVLTGMAGRALMPGLGDPEQILPLLSNSLLPPVWAGVMMVVVLAAIMSTVDSLLILASSAVVRDYWQQIRGTTLSDHALANRGKLVTLVIGLIGIGFALHQTPLIFWFVLFAWSGLGAAFGPVLLCALWYPQNDARRGRGRHARRFPDHRGLGVVAQTPVFRSAGSGPGLPGRTGFDRYLQQTENAPPEHLAEQLPVA